ncbi:oxygenase [Lithospermum erythrorhizon]|uniref:Oxygenase n=1 Tax=Lithospermum erythrorhizon TaxID=34254 RepID=A0AAV3RPT7_LITER
MVRFVVMEEFDSLMLVPLLLVPLLLIIFKNSNKLFSTSSKLPPGPTPWPLIGNIHQLGNMNHVSLANFAKIYGPIMSFKLGHKPLIVASSPSIAMEILKKQDLVLSGRDAPRAFPYSRKELNQISMWTEEYNETSKYLRSLCKVELFSGKALTSQECLRATKVLEMVEFLKAREGEVVNISQLAFATNFNLLGNILLSKDLINLEEEIENNSTKILLRRLIDVASVPNLADLYIAFSELDLQGIRKKTKGLWQEAWSIWEPIVEERRNNIHGNKDFKYQDFVDTLVGQKFTNDGINQILMELFFAGSDTTTSTIEWMMSELIKNPRVMNNLRKELEKEIGQDTSIKESQLLHLPYLQACLKETLRLHPSAPLLLPRRAIEMCQVMNFTIPKNAQVLVNVWAIGRDPIVWEEPLEFKPERFLNSPIDFKGNDFEFLPFGSGRRMCPGYTMAARQIPLVIALLIQNFDWSLPKEEQPNMLDMKEKFGITLQKQQPLLLIPHTRT